MKVLSIDIETFSSVNLQNAVCTNMQRARILKYCCSAMPWTAERCRWSTLPVGEKIPAEVIDALTDDAVIKTAYNAAFERVCLSRYLSDMGVSLDPFHDNHPLSQECARYLNPQAWHCTMIWAATPGLPLSL